MRSPSRKRKAPVTETQKSPTTLLRELKEAQEKISLLEKKKGNKRTAKEVLPGSQPSKRKKKKAVGPDDEDTQEAKVLVK